MSLRTISRVLLTVSFVILIVMLLFGQLLGQPFVVFVETGSMEPTLQPNDGYVAIPAFFAGDVEVDDVILFEAQELGGGELTTHRVEAVTESGYITQGDANPFTDQDSDEPPVADGQIKSVGVQVDGNLLVVPGLGAWVTSLSATMESTVDRLATPLGIDPPPITTISSAILVLGLVLYALTAFGEGSDRRLRSRSEGGVLGNALLIVVILTLVVLVPVNFSMLLPSGVYQYEIASTESPTDDERIIGVGESGEVTYFMRNSGHLPVVSVLEPASDGVDVPDEPTYVPRRTTETVSVTMHAPEETGVYQRFVREHRYLVVLPPSLIVSLHSIHPLVALAAINATVGAVVLSVSVTAIGVGRIRSRRTRRDLSVTERLRRRFPPP